MALDFRRGDTEGDARSGIPFHVPLDVELPLDMGSIARIRARPEISASLRLRVNPNPRAAFSLGMGTSLGIDGAQGRPMWSPLTNVIGRSKGAHAGRPYNAEGPRVSAGHGVHRSKTKPTGVAPSAPLRLRGESSRRRAIILAGHGVDRSNSSPSGNLRASAAPRESKLSSAILRWTWGPSLRIDPCGCHRARRKAPTRGRARTTPKDLASPAGHGVHCSKTKPTRLPKPRTGNSPPLRFCVSAVNLPAVQRAARWTWGSFSLSRVPPRAAPDRGTAGARCR
jgi:hypothetical protein